MDYKLEIKPALIPEERHKIEGLLKKMGYDVSGGGTHTDKSACDISFGSEKVLSGGQCSRERREKLRVGGL